MGTSDASLNGVGFGSGTAVPPLNTTLCRRFLSDVDRATLKVRVRHTDALERSPREGAIRLPALER